MKSGDNSDRFEEKTRSLQASCKGHKEKEKEREREKEREKGGAGRRKNISGNSGIFQIDFPDGKKVVADSRGFYVFREDGTDG